MEGVKIVGTALLLTIILWPWPAYPQQDTIALAIRLLNEYTEEESTLLTNLAETSTEATIGTIKVVLERGSRERDKTLSDLKDLRWLESGERQARRVYRLVEDYTDGRIKALRGLLEKVPEGERRGVEDILERSVTARGKVLGRLQETTRERVLRGPGIEDIPTPLPFEEEPTKGRGIWER